jgi:hypothetical protein
VRGLAHACNFGGDPTPTDPGKIRNTKSTGRTKILWVFCVFVAINVSLLTGGKCIPLLKMAYKMVHGAEIDSGRKDSAFVAVPIHTHCISNDHKAAKCC